MSVCRLPTSFRNARALLLLFKPALLDQRSCCSPLWEVFLTHICILYLIHELQRRGVGQRAPAAAERVLASAAGSARGAIAAVLGFSFQRGWTSPWRRVTGPFGSLPLQPPRSVFCVNPGF